MENNCTADGEYGEMDWGTIEDVVDGSRGVILVSKASTYSFPILPLCTGKYRRDLPRFSIPEFWGR